MVKGPTAKRRVPRERGNRIAVDARTHAILTRLAKRSRRTMRAVVSELLQQELRRRDEKASETAN